ncbi:MAG: tyrosine-protein phosphatase [Gemmobacter sp.]
MRHPERHIALPGTHNIRDLGGYPTLGGRATEWRRVLRGDSPHRLDAAGQARLRDEGLRTVIDLRTAAEAAAAPNPFATAPGIAYHRLPLFDTLAPDAMIEEAARGDDPLRVFYEAAVEERAAALREILSAVAAAPEGGVLVHCTAGKDRTGLVAALVLGAAGVPEDAIVADYALTESMISALVAEFLELARRRRADTDAYARVLAAPAETMRATLARLAERHGSVEAYLARIGLPEGDRSALRDRMLGQRPVDLGRGRA